MPFLGSRNSHEPTCCWIAEYLERGSKGRGDRALARDWLNLAGDERRLWARAMDEERAVASAGGRPVANPVTYYHFVISPDPRDGVGVDMLRELAVSWAREMFGDEVSRGKLGRAQVAIVYHDDNSNRVPHAHLIVNNTDLDTGGRLHLSDRDNRRTMPDRLQEIARDMGLRHFDNDPAAERARTERARRGRFFTKEERALLKAGRFSWKQDLCNRIMVARRTTAGKADFLSELSHLGVGVRESGGDWVFSHPSNPARWQVCGYRLGRNYEQRALLGALDPARASARPETLATIRENVNRRLVDDFVRGSRAAALIDGGTTIEEAARALKVNEVEGIRCFEDYAPAIEAAERAARAASLAGPDAAARAERRLASLRDAMATAARGSFFEGVAPPPRRSRAGAPAGGQFGGNATGRSVSADAPSREVEQQRSASRGRGR